MSIFIEDLEYIDCKNCLLPSFDILDTNAFKPSVNAAAGIKATLLIKMAKVNKPLASTPLKEVIKMESILKASIALVPPNMENIANLSIGFRSGCVKMLFSNRIFSLPSFKR